MTTPPPAPAFEKPAGLMLVKGDGPAIYGIWIETGYTRQVTGAEYALMGSPKVDYTIPKGDTGQLAQFAAYDRALRA